MSTSSSTSVWAKIIYLKERKGTLGIFFIFLYIVKVPTRTVKSESAFSIKRDFQLEIDIQRSGQAHMYSNNVLTLFLLALNSASTEFDLCLEMDYFLIVILHPDACLLASIFLFYKLKQITQ